jgi:NADH dehydrogenase FAD-containing subunit
MRPRVVVLGAGFGGLELTTMLSDALGEGVDLVLIDQADSFVFGFAKLDVMFGRQLPAAVRHPYRDIVKPGVRFIQTTVRSIDPAAKRVVTDGCCRASRAATRSSACAGVRSSVLRRRARRRCCCTTSSPRGGSVRRPRSRS